MTMQIILTVSMIIIAVLSWIAVWQLKRQQKI